MTDTLYAPFAAWRDAALNDGWTEIEGGVWGRQVRPLTVDPRTGTYSMTGDRSEGDFTVQLRKDDMVVYLVDRADLPGRGLYICGWFKNGNHTMRNVPDIYDANKIEALRDDCTKCGQSVGRDNLKYNGYAAYTCQPCHMVDAHKVF